MILRRIDKCNWFWCPVCKMICPQEDDKDMEAVCLCTAEKTKMELLDEFDEKVQRGLREIQSLTNENSCVRG